MASVEFSIFILFGRFSVVVELAGVADNAKFGESQDTITQLVLTLVSVQI